MKKEYKLGALFWFLFILVMVWLLASCAKTVYVPVNTTKTEYRDNFVRDSIFLYDSIFVKEKGDTLIFEKYKYFYRDKVVKDSVFINDTIKVPYPVEKIKEVNVLKWWQRYLMITGFLSIAIFGIWLFLKLKK